MAEYHRNRWPTIARNKQAGSLTGDNSGGSHIRYKGSPSYLNINNTGGSTTSAAE